jgi:hypothetical protein
VDATTTTGFEVPEVLPTGNVASTSGSAATTSDGDGDELEVVMGHHSLQTSGHVSLPEAMGTIHFMLCQAQDMLQ